MIDWLLFNTDDWFFCYIDWCFVKFYNRIWNIFSNLCFQFFSTNLYLADFSCLELQKNNWKNDLYTQRSSTYNAESSEKRSLQQQELLTFLEYVSLSVVFSEVRVAQCLVFRVTFCRPLFVLLSLLLTCPSSIYGFWLPICYLQAPLADLWLYVYHFRDFIKY